MFNLKILGHIIAQEIVSIGFNYEKRLLKYSKLGIKRVKVGF